MSLVWPMMILRAVLVSIVCILLAGCNDTRGFSITDFRTAVDIAADGSAVVSEELTLLVKDGTNYGGVFFDVPLAFVDQAGWRRKRGFELLEAVHKGGDGYYTNRRTWDGRTIYVGHEHCRRCSTDLPRGSNVFRLSYRLDRLVEERDGKQVLNLPAYLSRISELNGSKTVSFRFPAGGILGSGLPRSQFKIIEYTPRSFGILMQPSAIGSSMADLKVEFPAGTFDLSSSTLDVVRWWFEDHLSKALIGASLIVTLLYSGLALHSLQVEKRTAPADLDPLIADRISPGLTAHIVHDKNPFAMALGFRGSIYWLAVKGFARISDRSQVTLVFPTGVKASRKSRRLFPPSIRTLLGRLNQRAQKSTYLEFDNAFAELLPTFTSAVTNERNYYGWIASSAAKYTLCAFCILFILSILSAYWDVYLEAFLLSLFLLILLIMVASKIVDPQRPGLDIRTWRDVVRIFVGFPIFIIACAVYFAHHIPTQGQAISWISSYVNLFGVGAWLWVLRRPSAKQKDLRRKIYQLQRALHQEPRLLAPAMSIDLYERFLPMAVALGEEKPWTNYFNDWLAASGTTYTPAWRCNADGGDIG